MGLHHGAQEGSEVEFQSKLKLPGIKRRSRSASRAARSGSRIAQRIDVGDIKPVQHIEPFAYYFQFPALVYTELSRKLHVHREKSGPHKCVSTEISHTPEEADPSCR